MVNQQKKRKSKNKAIEVIIVVFSSIALGVMILGLFILWITNPYDTKEKRQVKPIYRATMKGVPGFRLTGVTIDKEYNSVIFNLKIVDGSSSSRSTEEEIEAMYRAIKQLEYYLNENDWAKSLYNDYTLRFQRTRPYALKCKVKYIDGEAVCYDIYNDAFFSITDFHIMKDLRLIDTRSGFGKTLDKEKAENISQFENLEEIHFWEPVNEESLTEFAKIMNKNNPECKIFVEREEFILPE
ncbi:MAG TPA: hypothetical protein VFC79_03075 [Tissierellaceae bacterium]|nr:hypothetical protein [Tissierellaceae bacterium]